MYKNMTRAENKVIITTSDSFHVEKFLPLKCCRI